jgi:hypothetical protein
LTAWRRPAHGPEPCAQEHPRDNGLTTNVREPGETGSASPDRLASEPAGQRRFPAIIGYQRNWPVDSSGLCVLMVMGLKSPPPEAGSRALSLHCTPPRPPVVVSIGSVPDAKPCTTLCKVFARRAGARLAHRLRSRRPCAHRERCAAPSRFCSSRAAKRWCPVCAIGRPSRLVSEASETEEQGRRGCGATS